MRKLFGRKNPAGETPHHYNKAPKLPSKTAPRSEKSREPSESREPFESHEAGESHGAYEFHEAYEFPEAYEYEAPRHKAPPSKAIGAIDTSGAAKVHEVSGHSEAPKASETFKEVPKEPLKHIEAPNASEAPNEALEAREASKTSGASKASEAPKEAPKASEASNAGGNPKTSEAPKASGTPKASETPKKAPKTSEASKTSGNPKASEASKEAPKTGEASQVSGAPEESEVPKEATNVSGTPKASVAPKGVPKASEAPKEALKVSEASQASGATKEALKVSEVSQASGTTKANTAPKEAPKASGPPKETLKVSEAPEASGTTKAASEALKEAPKASKAPKEALKSSEASKASGTTKSSEAPKEAPKASEAPNEALKASEASEASEITKASEAPEEAPKASEAPKEALKASEGSKASGITKASEAPKKAPKASEAPKEASKASGTPKASELPKGTPKASEVSKSSGSPTASEAPKEAPKVSGTPKTSGASSQAPKTNEAPRETAKVSDAPKISEAFKEAPEEPSKRSEASKLSEAPKASEGPQEAAKVSDAPNTSETPRANGAPKTGEVHKAREVLEISEASKVSGTPKTSEAFKIGGTSKIGEASEVSGTRKTSEASRVGEAPKAGDPPRPSTPIKTYVEAFSYPPLSPERGEEEIRLLRLQSLGDDSKQILSDWSLETFTSGRTPPYNALSYTWADPSTDPSTSTTLRREVVKVNSKHLKITTNLADFLRHLENDPLERWAYIWIDAICIDQENVRERNLLVPRMKQIYEQASQVIIWLGSDRLNVAKMFTSRARGLAKVQRILGDNEIPKIPRAEWAVIGQNPGNIVTSCPPENDGLAIFENPWWTRAWIIQEASTPTNDDTRIVHLHGLALKRVSTEHVVWIGKHRFTFDQLVEVARYYSKENRGTSSVKSALELDMVQKDRQGRTRRLDLYDLLPMVRRYDCADARDKIYSILAIAGDYQPNDLRPDYSKPVSQIYTGLVRYLIERDKCLDILGFCSAQRNLNDLPSWVPDWTYKDVPASLLNLERQHGRRTPFNACGRIRFSVQFRNWDSSMRCYGLEFDKVTNVGPLRNQDYESFYSQLSSDEKEKMDELSSTTKSENHRQDRRTRHRTSLPDPDMAVEAHIIYEATMFRRLIWTQRGHIGLAPVGVHVGNIICILGGCRVPLVLRRGLSGYKLVGECYILGIMAGEAEYGPNVEKNAMEFNIW
jgi:hypothetical protein